MKSLVLFCLLFGCSSQSQETTRLEEFKNIDNVSHFDISLSHPVESKLDFLFIENDIGTIFYTRDVEKGKIDRIVRSINYVHKDLFENKEVNLCITPELKIFLIESDLLNSPEFMDFSSHNFELSQVNGLYHKDSIRNTSLIFLNSDLYFALSGRTSIHEYYHHYQTITCDSSQNWERDATLFTNKICGKTELCQN
tara:strand:+ start:3648 stop:4235 length:588 start_codon:yes stop_codon:yes gene_type:complete